MFSIRSVFYELIQNILKWMGILRCNADVIRSSCTQKSPTKVLINRLGEGNVNNKMLKERSLLGSRLKMEDCRMIPTAPVLVLFGPHFLQDHLTEVDFTMTLLNSVFCYTRDVSLIPWDEDISNKYNSFTTYICLHPLAVYEVLDDMENSAAV